MNRTFKILFGLAMLVVFLSFIEQNNDQAFDLTIKVENLRNSKGVVQFALYNKDGSIPDEKYKKYFKKKEASIINNSSIITFTDLPIGKYAINILHDENRNGKIDKKFILPKEGIGFSNYETLGLSNRPNFSKSSFVLNSDKEINVKVIYM